MANICTALIPLSNIERIQIYMNEKRTKTLAQIKKETGADYLINGTLYNMSNGEAVCHLKVDGKPICSPDYSVHGHAWNTPADFGMSVLPNVPLSGDIGKRNYIGCVPLILDGQPVMNPCIASGLLGKRGRTAIGTKGGSLALYCTKDGTTNARTIENLRNDLVALGWDSATLLDGGGSAQCDLLGDKVTSSRKVAHLVLVHLKQCPYKEPTASVKCGSTGEGAKWVQWMLNKHTPGLVVDGIFGAASTAALKAFQKSVFADAKEWDGICGAKTREALKKGV